jgi:hypothetical protein
VIALASDDGYGFALVDGNGDGSAAYGRSSPPVPAEAAGTTPSSRTDRTTIYARQRKTKTRLQIHAYRRLGRVVCLRPFTGSVAAERHVRRGPSGVSPASRDLVL